MASDPSSPIGSTFFFGGAGGSGSRGDESASPLSFLQPVQGGPEIEEECDSSPEEGKKNSGRKYWSEEENIRLVSAWLNNSNDLVKGNDKKFDHYWKEVTKEYNKYSPKDRRRSVPQCKIHWNKNAPVEDERDSYGARKDFDYDQENTAPMIQQRQGAINEFARMLEINTAIHDRSTHRRLKADLTEHIWQQYGHNHMEQNSESSED
ncbi:unnamed protein product [Urochloa humidicola]